MERIAVIGVGNRMMGDDGVGIAVVEALRDGAVPAWASGHADIGGPRDQSGDAMMDAAPLIRLPRRRVPRNVSLVELATGGMNLLHVLNGLDAAVIVDAGDFGGRPGEVRVLTPEEVRSVKTPGYSLHDWDLFTALRISEELGERPRRVVIVAVQPEAIDMREGLSGAVLAAVPEAVDAVLGALRG